MLLSKQNLMPLLKSLASDRDVFVPATIDGVKKFARFATSVFDVPADGKTDEQLAEAGLEALSAWMDEIGVVRHASELGLTEENIPAAVKATIILDGGYHKLTTDEVEQIFRESL